MLIKIITIFWNEIREKYLGKLQNLYKGISQYVSHILPLVLLASLAFLSFWHRIPLLFLFSGHGMRRKWDFRVVRKLRRVAKVKITLYFNFMRQCAERRRVYRFMTKFSFTYKQLIKCRAKQALFSALFGALKTKTIWVNVCPELIAYTQRVP